MNTWCPTCCNKSEKLVYEKLKEIYPELKFQFRAEWCRNEYKKNNYLPFDFLLEDNKIIIELDGMQHFTQIGKWTNPEDTRVRDKYKMQKANENGFSIIRILQEDIYRKKYNWLIELTYNIEKITNDKKVQNIFMCKNNEYDIYKY
jgi:very-short-patch-repair endonuclease